MIARSRIHVNLKKCNFSQNRMDTASFIKKVDRALMIRDAQIIGNSIRWWSFYGYFKKEFDEAYSRNGLNPNFFGTDKYLRVFRSYLGTLILIALNHPIVFTREENQVLEAVDKFFFDFRQRNDWKVFTETSDLIFTGIDFSYQLVNLSYDQEKCLVYLCDHFPQNKDNYYSIDLTQNLVQIHQAHEANYGVHHGKVVSEAFGIS